MKQRFRKKCVLSELIDAFGGSMIGHGLTGSAFDFYRTSFDIPNLNFRVRREYLSLVRQRTPFCGEAYIPDIIKVLTTHCPFARLRVLQIHEQQDDE